MSPIIVRSISSIILLTISAIIISCDWLELAGNALTYRTTKPGEAANVVVYDSIAYATLAEDGMQLVNIHSGENIRRISSPNGSESVDDLAIVGKLLFVLDAKIPGHISVYSLTNPAEPKLVSTPDSVPVEPFSGISARDGFCFVSGGTSELTVWRYDSLGVLTGPIATADLGRGQPDILAGKSGIAFVSTHYWGPHFGLNIIRFDTLTSSIEKLDSLKLEGAGFTAGGAKPANFPIESALLNDDTLLVAFAKGLAVIDVSNPLDINLIETIPFDGKGVNVDAQNRTACVTLFSDTTSLAIIKFGSGANKESRKVDLKPGTFPTGVALSGDYAIVVAHEQGVLRIDIKNSNQLIGGDL